VPAAHTGRLPTPIRIGARMKPWELNLSSSPELEDSAFGLGVPVRLPDSVAEGTVGAGGGGEGGGAGGSDVVPPDADEGPVVDPADEESAVVDPAGCAPAGAARETALTPTSTAILARIWRTWSPNSPPHGSAKCTPSSISSPRRVS